MRRHNVPSLKTLFDETVFVTGGRSEFGTGPVFVANRADKFILNSVFGIPTVDTCRTSAMLAADAGATTYSLNAPNPCADLNVYSMSARHCNNRNGALPHRTIRVMQNLNVDAAVQQIVPITCDFFTPNVVYTDNLALTVFEMAVMLKFYSLQLASDVSASDVGLKITLTLYHKCAQFFDGDSRIWFYFDRKRIVVANNLGEYTINGAIVNFPRADGTLKAEPRL